MQLLLTMALLSAVVTANPVVYEKRQATNVAQFSSAANQLISLYIPASVAVPLGVAVQSAASAQGITGDINSIVQSALTATKAPAFLTAIPSQYKSNIVSLESAISALRGAAATGIPGAPRIVTSTNSQGSAVVTTMPGSTIVPIVVLTTTDSAGNTVTSTSTGSGSSASGSGTSGAAASASASGSSASAAASSTVAAASSSASAAVSSASASASAASSSASAVISSAAAPNASSSSSSGLAQATKAPIIGVGVLGFVGLLAAL